MPGEKQTTNGLAYDSCIDVDGSMAKVNRRAIGVICRDDHGRFQGASDVVSEHLLKPEVLETEACAEALKLVEDLQVQHLLIKSLSRTVSGFSKRSMENHRCGALHDSKGD
jgi:hypothetical protein